MTGEGGCFACTNEGYDRCRCGEVVCKGCEQKLNRADLSCFRCGSVKLDRTGVEIALATAEPQKYITARRGVHVGSNAGWRTSSYPDRGGTDYRTYGYLRCPGCADILQDDIILTPDQFPPYWVCSGPNITPTAGGNWVPCKNRCNITDGCKC